MDHIKELLGKPNYTVSLQWQTVEETLNKLKQFADEVETHLSRHLKISTVKDEIAGIDTAFAGVMIALEYATKFRELQRILIDKGGRAMVWNDLAHDQIVVES